MLVYTRIVGESAPEAVVLSGPDATVRELRARIGDSNSAAGRSVRLLISSRDDERLDDLGIRAGDLLEAAVDGVPQPRWQDPAAIEPNTQIAKPKRSGRRLSEYEELTQLMQWHAPFHINADRPSHEVWTTDSTALQCTDWAAFRTPDKLYYRTYMAAQSKAERSVHEAFDFAADSKQLSEVDPRHVDAIREVLGAAHFSDWGLCMVHQQATRFALSSWVAGATAFMMFDELRHAQLYGRLALAYEEHYSGFDAGHEQWMCDPRFQPLRRVVEELLAELDWAKAVVLGGTIVEPLVTTAIQGLLRGRGISTGDAVTTFVCQSISRDKERHRGAAAALTDLLAADPEFGADNRARLGVWGSEWLGRTLAAVEALAAGDVLTSHAVEQMRASIVEQFQAFDVELDGSRSSAELAASMPEAVSA
jgi:hypothetical protein